MSTKQPQRERRPIGFVLPALVFGLGIAELSIGIPKELFVRRLASSGVKVRADILAIEHRKGKEIDTLTYNVDGLPYTVTVEHDDKAAKIDGKGIPVLYLPDDPKSATADLASDAKIANEYFIAAVLELGVGGWILTAALRQRRRLLARTFAMKGKRER